MPVRDAVRAAAATRGALHHGDELTNARIAYRVVGPEEAPVIAVLGGISAHRNVCGADGWWPDMAGAGHGVDTRNSACSASIIWQAAGRARHPGRAANSRR